MKMFVLKFLVATTNCIRTATGYYNAAKQVGTSTYMTYRKRRKKETIVTLFACYHFSNIVFVLSYLLVFYFCFLFYLF